MADDRPIPQRMPIVGMAEAGEYHWCACKRTGTPPFCDGSHAKLPPGGPSVPPRPTSIPLK